MSVAKRRLRLLIARSRPKSGSIASSAGQVEPRPAGNGLAPVWMVSCELVEELPGVTEGGLNEAVAPAGKPLAESATTLLKVPFCALTVME
jgi:hypothetical protein